MAHYPPDGKGKSKGKQKASDNEPTGFCQILSEPSEPPDPMDQEVDDPKERDWNDLQAITAKFAYGRLSFEEIRLIDYIKGGGPVDSESEPHPPKLAPNLTVAFVPKPCSRCRTVFECDSAICFNEQTLNNFKSRTMIFRVGGYSDACEFKVYETFVPSRSTFIRTELEKDWVDHVAVFELPRCTLLPFTLYHHWVLTGFIWSSNLAAKFPQNTEYDLLVRAYVLGQTLHDVDFNDTLIDCIIHKLYTTKWFDHQLTQLIWNSTKPKCRLRKLWLDIYL